MKHLIALLITILTINCFGQKEEERYLKISDVKFQSIFGIAKYHQKGIYCLLGSGFFRTPRSMNSDSLMNDWIGKHKKAVVIPISSFGSDEEQTPSFRMIFCLVVQDGDTLNNFLVKNGCYPGSTMRRPKTWDEMDQREKDLYEDADEKPNGIVYMKKEDYLNFIEQIKRAEIYARERKLGVWKELGEDEYGY